MKALILAAPVAALSLAGCATQEGNAAVGALAGAAIGQAVSSDDDRNRGRAIGAAAGAIAGSLIGQRQGSGDCLYRAPDGSTFVAACP
ncbi:MAG: YMGG-like glycine zipper-containing protein [Hasllibacter sp.]